MRRWASLAPWSCLAWFSLTVPLACNVVLGMDARELAAPAAGSAGTSSGGGGFAGGYGGGGNGASAGQSSGGASGGGGAQATAWLENYGRRRPIRILADAVDEPLTDFMAAVVLAADSGLAAATQNDGDDIRFTAADGETVVPHEVESFDANTGQLAAWVRIALLSATEDTTLWLYYDNPAALPPDEANAWPSTFAGVWHLSDELSASGLAVRDSSIHQSHGSLGSSSTWPTSTQGVVSRAAEFDGGDDVITVGDPADGSLDFGTDSFSVCIWVRAQAGTECCGRPWSKGAVVPPNPGYGFELGMDDWSMDLDDGISEPYLYFGLEGEFVGDWTFLVSVIDRQNQEARAYTNSYLRDNLDISALGSLSGSAEARFGGDFYAGTIDEVQVVEGALSEAWISAAYVNLADPAHFLVVGPEELRP